MAAVPCASDRAAYEVGSLLCRSEDRLVCLVVDPEFRAVSDYYSDFRPLADVEVAQLLARGARPFPCVIESEGRPVVLPAGDGRGDASYSEADRRRPFTGAAARD